MRLCQDPPACSVGRLSGLAPIRQTAAAEGTLTSAPTFSIVVPTFRRPDALRKTLVALEALDYDPALFEIIVIDDGSEPVVRQIVDEFSDAPVTPVLEAQERLGAARARNRGARIAGGELLLFCDDDILVPASHLQDHLATRTRHGEALVNGHWQFSEEVATRLRSTPFGRYRIDLEQRFKDEAAGLPLADDPACFEVSMVGSWNLSLRRELFWEIGGFDEDFPVAGAEDQELSLRARAAGSRLLLDTRIQCWHNDNRLTLEAYCSREERSAQTMPFMAEKYPREFGEVPYVRENRPVRRDDPPSLVGKKLVKAVLASPPVLRVLHRCAGALERLRAPEHLLRRVYAGLLGLHLYRGFRRSWSG